MPIEASGFRQEPFDESKIHGDTAYLRAQVANKLEPEETQAKGLMEKHSQAALGVRNDSKTLEQVTTNGQAEIDNLFTKKEGEIRDFLATQLPKTEVEPFLGKLRLEWHENHDLHKNTLGLIAEAEQKAKPSPEDVYREVAKPKTATPPGALGAEAPSATAPSIPGFDINDIIKKFMEMYKEDQLATQLGKAFTGGSSPIPGLDEALHEWNKSTLLSTTADLEKRERLYEKIKGLISGNVPEDQAAKGQPKKGVEEAAPKPSLRAGGPEAGAPVQGVRGVGGDSIPLEEQMNFLECIQRVVANFTAPVPTELFKAAFNEEVNTIQKMSLKDQVAHLQAWVKDAFTSKKYDFDKLQPDDQLKLRNLTLNSPDQRFNELNSSVFAWAEQGGPQADLLQKTGFWVDFLSAQLDRYPNINFIGQFLSERFFTPFLVARNPYADYPGVTFDQLVKLCQMIPGNTVQQPRPATDLDKTISTIYLWANDPNTPVADAALARALLNKAVEFGKATPEQDIRALCQWAMVWKDTDGKAIYQAASLDAKTQFLFPSCKGSPLYQQCQDVIKWFNSIDPTDSRTRAVWLQLAQDINKLIPNGTFAQLQALEVKYIRGNPDFFKMSAANQKFFFDITGTHLEALRYRISNWAQKSWENDFLKTILAQIDTLENGQSGDMTSELFTFFIDALRKGALFTYEGLRISRIYDLRDLLDPSKQKLEPASGFFNSDYTLDEAMSFQPSDKDQKFWHENVIEAILKLGHGSSGVFITLALNYLRANDNYKMFLHLDELTQSKYLEIMGPFPEDMKILALLQTLAATDPARNLINDILDVYVKYGLDSQNTRVEYLNYYIFKQGVDLFFDKKYASITEDQFNQICDILDNSGVGKINRPKATDIDKVLFNSFRSQSATDGGFFNLIFTYLKDHAIDCQKWTKEQFQAWAISAASDLFLSDRTKFWSTFGNFIDADIKAAAAIGLIIPPKTDPFPDILKKMQNQLGPLQPLLDIVRRFAGVFGMSADFNAWTDQDWAKLPGLLNKAITDLANKKNWKKYGITDQNQANIAVAQLKSAKPALQGRTLIQFKTAYNLFSGAINEIQALQKRQPQGTIQELSDWAKKQDASKLSGADLAIFNTLIIK